jgi:hypothetical protein
MCTYITVDHPRADVIKAEFEGRGEPVPEEWLYEVTFDADIDEYHPGHPETRYCPAEDSWGSMKVEWPSDLPDFWTGRDRLDIEEEPYLNHQVVRAYEGR